MGGLVLKPDSDWSSMIKEAFFSLLISLDSRLLTVDWFYPHRLNFIKFSVDSKSNIYYLIYFP